MSASPIFTVPSPFTSPHEAVGIVVVVVVDGVVVVLVGGLGELRWWVVGGGQSAPPLSSAGLPATSACVNVGPPLFASGAIPGSVLMRSPVPWQRLFVQVVPVGQSVGRVHGGSQLVPTSMLCPPDVKFRLKFWHASLGGSCAKMVYLNVTSPRHKKAPPPCGAMLLLIVTLTSVAVPLSCWIPAPESAVLPDIVTLVSFTS